MLADKSQAKIRLLAVAKMLKEGRRITSAEIVMRLDKEYDITADRKTVYSDIRAVAKFMHIDAVIGKNGGYKVCNDMEECKDGNQESAAPEQAW